MYATRIPYGIRTQALHGYHILIMAVILSGYTFRDKITASSFFHSYIFL
ncbi:hypothetical protein BRYFOR_07342 [Marvinbryantia formatexigens DSM 14469]|uniref:Uncharacterized protein n=1 Tax=Marvinbryantia formatexigens DSM 14469 TaxID=478749 RepID=C6LFE0_9FIRM|nr:hypothetical protein BRYFOR_07342 [Marvinbryantia formatexigens DSM 14469]